jgi:hypothetical protein
MTTMSGRVAASLPGSRFVRLSAALRREGADEVDVRVPAVQQPVPEHRTPAARRAGDRIAERHDADGVRRRCGRGPGRERETEGEEQRGEEAENRDDA